MRRAVSAPTWPAPSAEGELEVKGHAATIGTHLAGHIPGAMHASLSPVARPQMLGDQITEAEGPARIGDRASTRTEVALPEEAACNSLLVVCDDEAAAGRSRSAHRTRRAECVQQRPCAAAPEGERHVLGSGHQPGHALVAQWPLRRGEGGMAVGDLARRDLRSGPAAVQGGGRRPASRGWSVDRRPVTAPGQIHTGRAPLTKEWASQQLADASFGAAVEPRVKAQQGSRDGRAQALDAAQGQFMLQLNIQAAQAFERVARQSSPVVLWGSSRKVLH